MSVKKLLGAAAWKGLLLAVVTLLLLLAAAALMLQRGLVGESAASALVCAAYAAAVMIGGGGPARLETEPEPVFAPEPGGGGVPVRSGVAGGHRRQDRFCRTRPAADRGHLRRCGAGRAAGPEKGKAAGGDP